VAGILATDIRGMATWLSSWSAFSSSASDLVSSCTIAEWCSCCARLRALRPRPIKHCRQKSCLVGREVGFLEKGPDRHDVTPVTSPARMQDCAWPEQNQENDVDKLVEDAVVFMAGLKLPLPKPLGL
jgi:hypothetical protein